MLKEITMLISLVGLLGSGPFVKNVVKGDGDAVVDLEKGTNEGVAASEKGYASGIFHYSDFKTSYFDNLTRNFGVNYKGSCGYVAIGMLLSYYDTYLNDDIIPEKYDAVSSGDEYNMIERRNSPGIMGDFILGYNDKNDSKFGESLSAEKYYSWVESMADVSLHAKLITIGNELGLYNWKNNAEPCLTNYKKRYDILNSYLTKCRGFSLEHEYSIEGINGENNENMSPEVRKFAIDQVMKGNPVIISVKKENSSTGHVVVAYDYDEKTDSLYCNMGWFGSTTHRRVEDHGYQIYRTAMAIHFNFEHTCSDNYVVGGQAYCYQNKKIMTYGHTYSYEKYSSEQHRKKCSLCGLSILEKHSVDKDKSYRVGAITYANCVYCGEMVNLSKTIGYITDPTSLTESEEECI